MFVAVRFVSNYYFVSLTVSFFSNIESKKTINFFVDDKYLIQF